MRLRDMLPPEELQKHTGGIRLRSRRWRHARGRTLNNAFIILGGRRRLTDADADVSHPARARLEGGDHGVMKRRLI